MRLFLPLLPLLLHLIYFLSAGANDAHLHRKVTEVLRRLKYLIRDMQIRFPNNTIRFDNTKFTAEVELVAARSSNNSVQSCPWSHNNNATACGISPDGPIVPTLTNPLDDSKLIWNSNLTSYFEQGPAAKRNATSSCQSTQALHKDCRLQVGHGHVHDLILLNADKYDCHRMSLLLRTLRATGCCAEVVIFQAASIDGKGGPCREIEGSCGGVLYEDTDEFPSVHDEMRIYFLYLRFLNRRVLQRPQRLRCQRVLLLDFEEMFFQRDPFSAYFPTPNSNAEVLLTDLGFEDRYKLSGRGYKDMLDVVSQQVLRRNVTANIGLMTVINYKFVFGSFFGVYKLLWVFSYVADLMDIGWDTAEGRGATRLGLLNLCYYTGLFNRAVTTALMPQAISPYLSGKYAIRQNRYGLQENSMFSPLLLNSSRPFDNLNNPIVNHLGAPFSIVAYFSKFHTMALVENWILKFGGIDWKHELVGQAKKCNQDA